MDDHHQAYSRHAFSHSVSNRALSGSMLAFEFHSSLDDIQKLEVCDSSRRKVYDDMVGNRSAVPGFYLDQFRFRRGQHDKLPQIGSC